MTLLKMMGQGHLDDFQTPAWAVDELMQVIERDNGTEFFKEHVIWEPACGRGNIVKALHNRGYSNAFGSDIIASGGNIDFLKEAKNEAEIIITNPPFSLKNQFLEKCYSLNIPFALLLPINALGSVKRKEMFKEHGIQLVMLSKRVDFEYPDGSTKEAPWFETMWFTHGFDLEKDINFV